MGPGCASILGWLLLAQAALQATGTCWHMSLGFGGWRIWSLSRVEGMSWAPATPSVATRSLLCCRWPSL